MSTKEEDELVIRQRHMDNLLRDLNLLIPYFETKTITNIFIYGDGRIQVDDFRKGISDTGKVISAAGRMRIIHNLASMSETPIDIFARPVLESIIPKYNIRTTAILPPWVEKPEITFRRPAGKILTLEEYREQNRISESYYNLLIEHIEKRSNIIISGSTGSGKTTFVNACIEKMREFTPDERFYVIEDTPELQCGSKNLTQLYIRKDQAIFAIQTALRWSPKRIIFGELRSGDVAVELLEAWNTGHPGNITTIHADSAESTIPRLEGLLRQKYSGALPDISDTVQLIVHLTYGRKIGKHGEPTGPVVDAILTTKEIMKLK
ncbi:conjugal transfer protein TrbB [Spirochaetia bacterium]|nr:conjugal transfer protein TrbB [Spirochaetia bacterium]